MNAICKKLFFQSLQKYCLLPCRLYLIFFRYLIFKLLTDIYLGLFILIILLLAVDFWICKNILGPKLAGIRWFIK
jgi:hypothetical protein